MIAALINRKSLKREIRTQLKDAQVSPKAMTALYLGLSLVLTMLEYVGGEGFLSTFLSILTSLLTMVLTSGFVLYCMAIRRGERVEFLALFDGFSFASKIIILNLLIYIFITLWTMAFIIPGIIAAYRYRFALFNLYENPDISPFQALEMSKRQTVGYKAQLFALDISYLGWFILAAIPMLVESGFLAFEMAEAMMPFAASGMVPSMSVTTAYSIIPPWGWALLCGAWSLVVSLFYLPHYQCTDLGYFEIAKETSGIGSAPHQQTQEDGPDNMGSF